MIKRHMKIAVTGGAGQIGYSLLFRIANGDMFGKETTVSLKLLELENALPRLEGTVMELMDCAFPLLKSVDMTSDPNQAMKDINWALLVGSVPRKQGMERSDLLEINGKVFTEQGRAINDNAAGDVKVFVVGNPCNTNCLIAMNNAKDIPQDRFYAMTMLDENRAKAQLAQKAGSDVTDVQNMIVWGNHSSTMYPDFEHASIAGRLAPEVISDEAWLKGPFLEKIQKRGAEILQARGASSAASAASAAIDGVRNIDSVTPAGQSYSMALCSKGEYGVDEGLIFSYPCRTFENGNLEIIKGIEHSVFAKEKIQLTLQELRQERDIVKSLGLIEG